MKLFSSLKKHPILVQENIRKDLPSCSADEAIVSIGNQLVKSGYADPDYIVGMLEREHSLTTCLGCGIAMPHGEYEVGDSVKKTGMAVDIYPQGIDWNGQQVYVVIGICARACANVSLLQAIAERLPDQESVLLLAGKSTEQILEMLSVKL